MKIATISDLQKIKLKENNEPLCNLAEVPSILSSYRRKDSLMQEVLVRQSVAQKLQKVQQRLTLHNPRMQLLVVEGYRTMAYQESYFAKELAKASQSLPPHEILELTHKFVALPNVAGHPTGGAIDLTIAFDGNEIDMGGKIADFSIPETLPTYAKSISLLQKERRMLLHDLMVQEGFAPFYGEWWHFSYGDREWAFFYEKEETLYSSLEHMF